MRNRMISMICSAALAHSACSFDPQITHSSVSKIIGENSLTPVLGGGENLPEALRPLIAAIGLLEIGCTVTHIGNGLVITAAHCIPQSALKPEQCLSEGLPGMNIQWGYIEGKTLGPISRCLKLIARELSSSSDFAVLHVEQAPASKIEMEMLNRPREGQRITLFGHPKKRPLEWSQYCGIAPLPQIWTVGISPDEQKNIFAHQCDTESGNSGSAIIDAETLKVIGIHHGGKDDWNTATWTVQSELSATVQAHLVQLAAARR